MRNMLTTVLRQNNDNNCIEWFEVVLQLSDLKYLNIERIHRWDNQFAHITVVAAAERPAALSNNISWHKIDEDRGRSRLWGSLLEKARRDWVFFLEDDEFIRLESIPNEQYLDSKTWVPTLIRQEKTGGYVQYYQMRLIHTTKNHIFDGKNLPDCTRYIIDNEIQLLNHSVVIERSSSPMDNVDIDVELSLKNYSPKLYLVSGDRYFKEKKYVLAAAQYRRLLKEKILLPFDRLGAVNGLASCLVEQYKWDKALTLSHESLNVESLQSLPYLIQYRIYELRKEWKKAYDIIKQYYERFSLYSQASFDQIIDEEKTLINLANVALKAGMRRAATRYFGKLFMFKKDGIDRSLLKKVLVLSIELEDFERSVYLFERLFKDYLFKEMSQELEDDLDHIMTMFIKKEWYDYVLQIYTRLHKLHPDNYAYKRKLIVTFTKADRLDKAKAMLANIV